MIMVRFKYRMRHLAEDWTGFTWKEWLGALLTAIVLVALVREWKSSRIVSASGAPTTALSLTSPLHPGAHCPGFVADWTSHEGGGFAGMCVQSLRITAGRVSIVTYDYYAPIFQDGFDP